jgi:26S proteasome regulatory subunit N2
LAGLEARRLDIVERAITESVNMSDMLSYCLSVVMSLVSNIEFRMQCLRQLSRLYMQLESPDYINVCRVFVFLDDFEAIANVFKRLLVGNDEDVLLAYQVAFDMCSNATQHQLSNVRDLLKSVAPAKQECNTTATATATDAMAVVDESTPALSNQASSTSSGGDDVYAQRYNKLQSILSGELSITLHLEFLHRNCHSDLAILKNTKVHLDHQAIYVWGGETDYTHAHNSVLTRHFIASVVVVELVRTTKQCNTLGVDLRQCANA